MILGNSRGNNLGEKYRKLNGRETATIESRMEYEKYALWMSNSYSSLVSSLKSSGGYNPEVFNETFLKVSQKILFGELKIKDYASYFARAYFTNNILSQVKKGKEVYLELEVESLSLASSNYDCDIDMLLPKISEYVKLHYPEVVVTIFTSYYLSPNKNTTFRDLAKEYDVSLSFVHKSINGVLDGLKRSKSADIKNLLF